MTTTTKPAMSKRQKLAITALCIAGVLVLISKGQQTPSFDQRHQTFSKPDYQVTSTEEEVKPTFSRKRRPDGGIEMPVYYKGAADETALNGFIMLSLYDLYCDAVPQATYKTLDMIARAEGEGYMAIRGVELKSKYYDRMSNKQFCGGIEKNFSKWLN